MNVVWCWFITKSDVLETSALMEFVDLIKLHCFGVIECMHRLCISSADRAINNRNEEIGIFFPFYELLLI